MAKILIVHQPVDGGVGRHVADLGAGLTARGHEAILCGPRRPDLADASAAHVPLALTRAIAPRADLATATELTRIIGATQPDLVHAHSSKAGAVARLARLRHPRVPVVYTPHGYAFAGYFPDDAARRRYRRAERLLASMTSMVICVCEAEARLARTVAPRSRIRIVHNGMAPVTALPLGGPSGPGVTDGRPGPVIGTLTQLRPGKGVETLLKAFGTVIASEPTARLSIWGAGPDHDQLAGLSRGLGVEEAVTFHGATADPIAAIRSFDIFCLPSEAEGFPYVVLEAMLVGRPIVASDVGGVAEALDGGRAGLLVPAGDAEVLADRLLSLCSDPARADELASTARARVESHFTLDGMVEEIVDAYMSLLAAAQPGAPPSVQTRTGPVRIAPSAIRLKSHAIRQDDPDHLCNDASTVDHNPGAG